jgi:hypothetical protein
VSVDHLQRGHITPKIPVTLTVNDGKVIRIDD